MKTALMLAMIEFTESGDQKVSRFHRSSPSVEGSGSMMDLVSVFGLNTQIMSGRMILWPTEQETDDQLEF